EGIGSRGVCGANDDAFGAAGFFIPSICGEAAHGWGTRGLGLGESGRLLAQTRPTLATMRASLRWGTRLSPLVPGGTRSLRQAGGSGEQVWGGERRELAGAGA